MDIMFTLNLKNKITLAIACALSTTAFHGQAAQWQGKVLDKAGNPVAKAEVSLDSFNKKVFTTPGKIKGIRAGQPNFNINLLMIHKKMQKPNIPEVTRILNQSL